MKTSRLVISDRISSILSVAILIFFLFMVFAPNRLKGQETGKKENEQVSMQRPMMFKISLLALGGFEHRITPKTTFNVYLGYQFTGIGISSNSTQFFISPQAMVSYRYYYNFRSRMDKGKNIDAFSGNYFSLFARTLLLNPDVDVKNRKFYSDLGLHYGFQRAIGQLFFIDLSGGFGINYYNAFEDVKFLPSVKIGFGIRL
jgi:hypothetical protein